MTMWMREPIVAEWGVIPSIRVRDMTRALAFYRETLGFTLDSGGDDAIQLVAHTR